MSREIDALNDEMVAAGVRKFVGGLSRASRARSLRAQPRLSAGHRRAAHGDQEHMGGFWVLQAADLHEAPA
jgi:hypothetical protein